MISIKTTLFGLAALTLLATVAVAEGRRGEHGRQRARAHAPNAWNGAGRSPSSCASLRDHRFPTRPGTGRGQEHRADPPPRLARKHAASSRRAQVEPARRTRAAIRASRKDQIKAVRERTPAQVKPSAKALRA